MLRNGGKLAGLFFGKSAATSRPLLELTPAAAMQLKEMSCSMPGEAILIGLRRRGCNGNAYEMSFLDQLTPDHEVINDYGVRLAVRKADLVKIIGTQIDFQQTDVAAGFTFKNPNATGACGCGESFSFSDESGENVSPCGLRQ